jgi:cysteine desulfuration protein SufE
MSEVAERIEELKGEFEFLDDWEDRYRYIIDIGKELSPLSPEEKTDETKVRGCTSQVWLIMEKDAASGNLIFRGESDSTLVQGLVGVLIRIYSDAKAIDIAAIPPEKALGDLQLFDALSPSRANGLKSMAKKITEFANLNS